MFKNVQNMMGIEGVRVCRLCLAEEEDLINIFNPNGYQGLHLWEIIEELLQMEVSKKDGLPWTICEECISNVKEFKHFKTTCIKAKISFLTMIANRGLVSSSATNAPSCVSQVPIIAIQKRSSGETSRKDCDEVEVVMKEDTPVLSGDEDPLREITVVRRDEDHGEKSRLAPEPLLPPSRETTKDIWKRPSSGVKRKDSDKVEEFEMVEEKSPVTSADEDPLQEVTVSRRERERRHIGKSCLPPRPPSWPSRESTKTILKRATRKTSRNDYDEVEVVEIVKEETPVLSADEDPPREVTVSRREGDRGQGEKIHLKEEVAADDPLSDAETCGQEIHWEDESMCIGVSNGAILTDPLDLKDLKEDADAVESWSEAVTYSEKDLQESDCLDAGASNVVCLPIEMGELCGAKEEDHASESLAEEKAQGLQDLSKDESHLASVESVISVLPSLGNVVDGCSIKEGSPKLCEDIMSNFSEKRKMNITKKFERNTSQKGLPWENSLSTFSAIKRERFQSGDYITSALDLSDVMTNELRQLHSHEKQLVGCTELICDYCGDKYMDKNKLAVHVTAHISMNRPSTSVITEDSSLKCFKSRSTAIQSSKRFKCETCAMDFKLKYYLTRHLATHSNMKFKCETCGKEFRSKGNLLTHSKEQHSALKPFKCDTCGNQFTYKSRLNAHMLMHSGMRPFTCDRCGKGFVRKSNLVNHSTIHRGLRPFKCDTCEKVFSQKSALVKHSFIHSGLRPFKCDKCGKGFARKSYLVNHSAIHSGLRPFKCDTCEKGFVQKSDLVAHSVIHSGLRPFKCDTCEKGFVQKSGLVKHLAIHSGLRPFKCDTCEKRFVQKSGLVKHSAVHSGLRPFKCDTCNKRFPRKCALVKHSAMHSGLRPFRCDTCMKGFTHKSSLVKHSVTHTDLRRFKCDTCGKGFTQESSLVRHNRSCIVV